MLLVIGFSPEITMFLTTIFPPVFASFFISGTKLKSACDMATGCMVGMEILRGRAGMVQQ